MYKCVPKVHLLTGAISLHLLYIFHTSTASGCLTKVKYTLTPFGLQLWAYSMNTPSDVWSKLVNIVTWYLYSPHLLVSAYLPRSATFQSHQRAAVGIFLPSCPVNSVYSKHNTPLLSVTAPRLEIGWWGTVLARHSWYNYQMQLRVIRLMGRFSSTLFILNLDLPVPQGIGRLFGWLWRYSDIVVCWKGKTYRVNLNRIKRERERIKIGA